MTSARDRRDTIEAVPDGLADSQSRAKQKAAAQDPLPPISSECPGLTKLGRLQPIEQSSRMVPHASDRTRGIRGQAGMREGTGDQQTAVGRMRFYVALLGLAIAAVNCFAQATFCIVIVEMVYPADMKLAMTNSASVEQAVVAFKPNHPDQSCPLEERYRDFYDPWRLSALDKLSNRTSASTGGPSVAGSGETASAQIDLSDRFNWDAGHQGLLLGAFAIGTAPLQVFGGRLAEIYGAKWVLLASCVGTGLTNLAIPFLARFSYALLLLNRVIMGVSQAGMEPGLMCLLAGWLAPSETGFFISMLLFAMCIGFFFGSICPSFLLTLGYGWPVTYYVAGGLNLVVGLAWLFYATSWPQTSRLVSRAELAYIEQSKRTTSRGAPKPTQLAAQGDHEELETQTRGAPWRNIFTTPSVWAFIFCKISIRWCADVIGIELPTYLANVLHLSIKLNGILNSISSALFAIFSFITGYLVNEFLKYQMRCQQQEADSDTSDLSDSSDTLPSHPHSTGPVLRTSAGGLIVVPLKRGSFRRRVDRMVARVSKTTLRKLFQSVASFGSALAMFLMTQHDCNIVLSMSMLLVLSCCLVAGNGGELQIPYDMTSRYPGTLHGMACTLSVSGWLAPPLIGLILGDQPSSRYRWGIVWYMTASLNFLGGLVFVLFADASPRDFDRTRPKKEPLDETNQKPALDGYYNEACQRTPDGSPPTCKRDGKQEHHTVMALAGPTVIIPYKPDLETELSMDGPGTWLESELERASQIWARLRGRHKKFVLTPKPKVVRISPPPSISSSVNSFVEGSHPRDR